MMCTLLSLAGICSVLVPIGVFACCCPCDDKDAYVVNEKVYDHNGKYLGHSKKFRFTPFLVQTYQYSM